MSSLTAPTSPLALVLPAPGTMRRLLAFALVALLSATLAVPTGDAIAAGSGGSVATAGSFSMEDDFLRLLNASRAENGLKALGRVDGVDNVAREWADRMARDNNLRHRSSLREPFTGNWRLLGENVGVGYSAASLHKAFMNSPGHRENIMGDYDHVGIGVALTGSRAWVAFNFVKGDPATRSRYGTNPLEGGYATGHGNGGTFHDIKDTVHRADIEAMEDLGVAFSCATSRYCPDEPLRRAEMAEMLVAAFDLPAARERFGDVASSHPLAAAIGALAASGITTGCTSDGSRFCPEQAVTRAQMASFFQRAVGFSPTRERFGDVTSRNVHHADIGGLFETGITTGCNPPRSSKFCPDKPVTRAQMASFIKRALDL